jgi:hypothetical protein
MAARNLSLRTFKWSSKIEILAALLERYFCFFNGCAQLELEVFSTVFKIEILAALLERWITFMHKELIWIHDV